MILQHKYTCVIHRYTNIQKCMLVCMCVYLYVNTCLYNHVNVSYRPTHMCVFICVYYTYMSVYCITYYTWLIVWVGLY